MLKFLFPKGTSTTSSLPGVAFFLILIFSLSSALSFSQDSLSVHKTRKIKVLPLPAFGYSPETKTFIGVVTLFAFNFYNDSTTRTSNAKFEVNYTWNKQFILECEWNYFLKQEKWFTKGQVHYSQYPDLYYGIGSNTPESNKLIFNSNRFILGVFVLKKIGTGLFTGLNVRYIEYTKLAADSGITYPELAGESTCGIGVSLIKDTRNNLLTPLKGVYVFFNASYNSARSSYGKISLDLRYYKTWKSKYTLAFRFINDFTVGTPPFYDYAYLGGDKFVRGYYYGRYRDNCLTSLQAEFRLPVVWRFGLAAFGGLSDIYHDPGRITFESYKYNIGLGLRFLIDRKEKTNLRFDYAIGQGENNGFYVSFGESF